MSRGLRLDVEQAEKHVWLLTGDAMERVTIQTFDDDAERKLESLRKILHGPISGLQAQLDELQQGGAGVYITVNETNLEGRKKENIVRVRALVADNDDGPFPDDLRPAPSFRVQSKNGQHAYWLCSGVGVEEVEGLQKGVIARLGTDRQVCDRNRVLRLAGSWHLKDQSDPYLVTVYDYEEGLSYTREQLLKEFPPPARPLPRPVEKIDVADCGDVERAMIRYAKKRAIEHPAISGSGGHNDAWVTMAVLVQTGLHYLGNDSLAKQIFSQHYNPFCDPPWSEREVDHKAAQAHNAHTAGPLPVTVVSRKQKPALRVVTHNGEFVPATSQLDIHELTDLGNAYRFRDLYGQDLRYATDQGKWYRWDSSGWRQEHKGYGRIVVFKLQEEILRESRRAKEAKLISAGGLALETSNSSPERILQDWAKKSQSSRSIDAVEKNAKVLLHIDLDQFNRNPDIFAAQNCTIDLPTGEGRSPRRADFCSHISPTRYNENAECPRWEAFVLEICGQNGERAEFLRRLAGYCMTGHTREQKFCVFYGRGRNGKSTFINTLARVLGEDFVLYMGSTDLDRESVGRHAERIACLVGKRLAISPEVNGSRGLNQSLVKSITGGDRIRADFKHCNSFEFTPRCKLIMHTNDPLHIDSVDEGIWRRIIHVAFREDFKGREDSEIEGKLLAESEGILAWAARGAREWFEAGLSVPRCIVDDTEAYRFSQDTLGLFVDEVIDRGVEHDGNRLSGRQLYEAYKVWCEDNGHKPFSSRKLGEQLQSRGIERIRSNGSKYLNVAFSQGWLNSIHVTDRNQVLGTLP